jgi:hypothetical protein
MMDAGMPMPALVFWMPMPTYGDMIIDQEQDLYTELTC